MPSWFQSTNSELKQVQKTANDISGLVAELYDLPRARHDIILATSEEIKQMKAKSGVLTGHDGSYIRSDGVIVICKPEGKPNPELEIVISLAAEFAHLYHRKTADNSRTPMWDYRWIDRTRLVASLNPVLYLPLSMLISNVIPRGKREATDLYCRVYVLEQLGEIEAAKKERQSNAEWNETVKRDLDTIRVFFTDTNGKPITYSKVKEGINETFRRSQAGGVITRDEHILMHRYFFLADSIGYFMADKHAQSFLTVEDFRSFVRTPVFPVTPVDLDFFNTQLRVLNEYLKENRSITLAVRKDARSEGVFGAAAYVSQ